ncbi:hypothetical protein M758_7G064500 [Ceratodon purpureus]|nr:hypothetical protein M758_7G064500 [Ceratodon purpureus]
MKKRDGDSRKPEGGSGGGSEFKKKKRLGGKGLSLETFVGANRIKPVVTASQIRKQRETYQNSKKVNKYRKTLKHLAEEGHEFRPRVPISFETEIPGEGPSDPVTQSKKEKPSSSVGSKKEKPSSSAGEKEPSSTEAENGSDKIDQVGGHGKKSGKGRQPKPLSHLERLREEYEKKKQEEEEIKKEKRALFEEQQAAREKSKKERKEVQKKFRKTTGKGQPVMKHRMEHLLESIQRDMKS